MKMFLLTQGTTWKMLHPLSAYPAQILLELCLTALEMQSQGEGSRDGKRHP